MKRFVVLALWSLVLGPVARAQKQPVPASVIQLIATPERFDGKLISVVGYLVIGQERHTFLYLHREDAEHELVAVHVSPSEDMIRRKEQLNGMYVRIEGVFRTTQAGAFPPGGWLVSVIKDVRECYVWSDPRRPYSHGDRTPPPDPSE